MFLSSFLFSLTIQSCQMSYLVFTIFPYFPMCFFFHVEVLKAFSDDDSHSFSYGLLELHCSELAEDLLDHALWRVFSAAGEDHRGVLGAAELEKALQAESGSSGADKAGGEAPGPFGAWDVQWILWLFGMGFHGYGLLNYVVWG